MLAHAHFHTGSLLRFSLASCMLQFSSFPQNAKMCMLFVVSRFANTDTDTPKAALPQTEVHVHCALVSLDPRSMLCCSSHSQNATQIPAFSFCDTTAIFVPIFRKMRNFELSHPIGWSSHWDAPIGTRENKSCKSCTRKRQIRSCTWHKSIYKWPITHLSNYKVGLNLHTHCIKTSVILLHQVCFDFLHAYWHRMTSQIFVMTSSCTRSPKKLRARQITWRLFATYNIVFALSSVFLELHFEQQKHKDRQSQNV